MKFGIKGKQVLGVTTIVTLVVIVLSVMGISQLARVLLDETRARGELLANAAYERARELVDDSTPDLYTALHDDSALRTILQSTLYSKNVTFAAIVDAHERTVMHTDVLQESSPLPPAEDISALVNGSWIALFRAIYGGQGRNLEFAQPLIPYKPDLGTIHIGVSTLLVRSQLRQSLGGVAIAALIVLGASVLGATVLAQILLRPIHVIRSGLTRLGKGEFGVRLDLEPGDEFGELGTFFNTMSAQLSADRSQMAGQVANLESAVQHLEDAVAIVNPRGHVLFSNPSLRALIPEAAVGASLSDLLGADHPLRHLAEQTLASRQSRGPVSASLTLPGGETGERLLLTHPVNDANGSLVGIMLIVRNVEYLSQVQSTVRYSRKLAQLGRLSAGVAHEVKNPLNAMMIHLELLRQHVSPRAAAGRMAGARGGAPVETLPMPSEEALQHVDVIAGEIRRLDEVVQGFLKFTRPEDLKLQPVVLAVLFNEVIPIVRPEAERSGVHLQVNCDGALSVNGDPAMLRQAFLNLALNACQAMPEGGTLSIAAQPARNRYISIVVSDTGVGIKPENLQKIFDLYFSTKPKGSGIGLSMVYRTIQMHDGEIEVQSTVGKGTTFTISLPQAS